MNEKGFTFTELIISICITSILSVILLTLIVVSVKNINYVNTNRNYYNHCYYCGNLIEEVFYFCKKEGCKLVLIEEDLVKKFYRESDDDLILLLEIFKSNIVIYLNNIKREYKMNTEYEFIILNDYAIKIELKYYQYFFNRIYFIPGGICERI